MIKDIGIIGLGAVGGLVARHLLEGGFRVTGFDIEAHRMTDVEGLAARTSPGEVAAGCGILITSLPSAAALRQVIAEGILRNAKPGLILLETSTLAVADKLDAEEKLAPAGVIFLDCPISGSVPMIANRTSTAYVGGERAAYEKCLPLLDCFTQSNFYMEKAGDSSKMKFLANYLVGVHTVAAAECMVLGQKAGLDTELIHAALLEGAGTSRMFELRGAMMAKSDYRGATNTMYEVFMKDAAIITEFAAEMDAPIELFDTSRRKLIEAIAKGLDHLDIAAVCKALEAEAGIERAMAHTKER